MAAAYRSCSVPMVRSVTAPARDLDRAHWAHVLLVHCSCCPSICMHIGDRHSESGRQVLVDRVLSFPHFYMLTPPQSECREWWPNQWCRDSFGHFFLGNAPRKLQKHVPSRTHPTKFFVKPINSILYRDLVWLVRVARHKFCPLLRQNLQT